VEELIREGARLWFVDGAIRRGPYCGQCYEAHRTLVRLDGADFSRCRMCRTFSPVPADAPALAGLDSERRS
jgi:hypothetical protein